MSSETIRVRKIWEEGFQDVKIKSGYPFPVGKRMCVFNAHETDKIGVIWCEVIENEAGYRPMTGKGKLAAPWYLARWKEDETREQTVERAERLADQVNAERGITPSEQTMIVASSMRVTR